MPQYTDMTGRTVLIPDQPQRIISLCPSQTATLAELGIGNRLAGITKFCVHPEEVWKNTPRVGGTKKINFDKIREIQPDLIICEKEENTAAMVAELEKEYPVFVTDVTDIESSLEMCSWLGRLIQAEDAATALNRRIQASLNAVNPLQGREVAYFIWKEPFMVAGRNTFIQSVLETCGLNNVFTALPGRYPEVSVSWIQSAAPEFIFLSSEPYPFTEQHFQLFQEILPAAKIMVVDGEYFSWYGAHMQHAADYLNPLLSKMREMTS